MSHPQPPQRQPTTTETEKYVTAIHNIAIASLVICPVLALLPPRKLDFYTISLVGLTGYSANHLYRESYGRAIWQRAPREPSGPGANLPTDRARDFQRQLRERREAELRSQGKTESTLPDNSLPEGSIAEQVWMGGEPPDWKERREKEIREAMAEGKGYGDIIMDQIWEVWNWGKKRESEDGSDDDSR